MSRKKEPTYITEQHDFPKRLQRLMKEQGTTQKQLGTAIGKRPQTVSLYTTGQSSPDVDTIRAIADYYDVSADWLLGRPGSTRTINADVQAVCQYTGLSEASVSALHNADDLDRVINATESNLAFFSTAERDFIDWLISSPDKLCNAIGSISAASLLDIRTPRTADGRKITTTINLEITGGDFVRMATLDGSKYYQRDAADTFTSIVSDYLKHMIATHKQNGGAGDAVDTQDAE